MPRRATRPVLAILSGVLLVLGGCLGTPRLYRGDW